MLFILSIHLRPVFLSISWFFSFSFSFSVFCSPVSPLSFSVLCSPVSPLSFSVLCSPVSPLSSHPSLAVLSRPSVVVSLPARPLTPLTAKLMNGYMVLTNGGFRPNPSLYTHTPPRTLSRPLGDVIVNMDTESYRKMDTVVKLDAVRCVCARVCVCACEVYE